MTLPTRVIDVDSTPRLHISGDGEVGRWVALSYCWGGDSTFTLNSTSFNNLPTGLPLLDFPLTLRDAVLVTRALGVRYLWIDSLCIFQDDKDDWAVEASRMSNVYSHAVVTIAATSAESVNDGFLGRRKAYFSCAFPWRRHDNVNSRPVLLRIPCDYFSDQTKQLNSRWAYRGWTFQEELLSQRLLCYMTERMIWYCRKGRAVEPEEDPGKDVSLFSTLKKLPKHSTGAVHKTWYEVLEKYTKRDLTFEKDRLPAIGAFSTSFRAMLRDQYCAGLWRGDLLYGLLWGCYSTRSGSGTPGKPLLCTLHIRPHPYGYEPSEVPQVGVSPGPSWSSVGAKSSMGWQWPDRDASCTYTARIVNVEVRHDSFGCVEGGELVLEAPYRHVHLRLGAYTGSMLSPVTLAQRVLTRICPLASTRALAQLTLTRPDCLASTATSRSMIVPSTSTDFTLIQVAKINHPARPHLYLLVLHPDSAKRGYYRRVGLLVLKPRQNNNKNYMGEEMISRLEDAAYREVAVKKWPTGTFIII